MMFLAGCGGAQASAPAPSPAPAPSAPVVPPSAPAPSVSSAPSTPPASSASASKPIPPPAPGAYDDGYDPTEIEHGAVIAMPVLLRKGQKTGFPKRTVGDKECWQGVPLQGDAHRDFDNLVGRCGAPTGLAEYVKPMLGHLHHKLDKRDTFKIKLHGGMCYRYFAVADVGIKNLDILVTKPNGALVANDKTSNPVAIIEFDKSWCMDDDAEYDFHVEVNGEGHGHYVFGVWAKPKGR
jgi:hypothetical protein